MLKAFVLADLMMDFKDLIVFALCVYHFLKQNSESFWL